MPVYALTERPARTAESRDGRSPEKPTGDPRTSLTVPLLDGRHPSVHAIVWFNLVKEADWRLEPGTPAARAFAAGAATWFAGEEH